MPDFNHQSFLGQYQTQKQALEQKHVMKLTPAQYQNQKILQCSAPFLRSEIEDYLLDYPLIETEYSDGGGAGYSSANTGGDENRQDGKEQEEEVLIHAAESVPNEFGDEYNDDHSSDEERMESETLDDDNSSEASERHDFLIDSLQNQVSLYQILSEQLGTEECSDGVRAAAEAIIRNLDQRGYFVFSMEDIAGLADCSEEDAAKALTLVQSFEPAGVAARNSQEFILLQLKRKTKCNPKLIELIQNHSAELEAGHLDKIMRAMGMTQEELGSLLQELRRVTVAHLPFGSVAPECVCEVKVTEDEQGEFHVESLHDAIYPKMWISTRALDMLNDETVNTADKEQVQKNVNALNELKKSLDARERLIVRIAGLLVQIQHDFIENGPEDLKPLTQKEIADKLGVDPSTVSRAIDGKYMDTPRGSIHFSDFFARGQQTGSGDVTIDQIKNAIEELIDSEDPFKPLSDETIRKVLEEKGFSLARRTVAKYREELGIRSSSERRRRA